MLRHLRRWLRYSRHAHLRENRVTDLRSLVGLVDRFIDGTLKYPLEWDDFISWKNENPVIEQIRDRIAALEPLFFSNEAESRSKAQQALLVERNHAASLVGITAREALVSRRHKPRAA